MLLKNRLLTPVFVAGVLLAPITAAARQPEVRIAVLAANAGAPGDPLPGTATETAATPGQPARAMSSWGFEVFGRGGWNRVRSTEEVTLGLSAGEDRDSVTAEDDLATWDFSGGLGVRAVRGRIGFEASWQRIRTEALRRFATTAGESGTGLDDAGVNLAETEADADLFAGQIVVSLSPGSRVSGFVGLGAGWLRVTDPVAAEFEAGTPLGEVPPELRSAFEVQVESDAGQAVLGGSAGLTIRAGRVFIRPRVEAWVGRELAGSYRIGFGADEPLFQGGIGIDVSSRLRPMILAFAVDIGFDLR